MQASLLSRQLTFRLWCSLALCMFFSPCRELQAQGDRDGDCDKGDCKTRYMRSWTQCFTALGLCRKIEQGEDVVTAVRDFVSGGRKVHSSLSRDVNKFYGSFMTVNAALEFPLPPFTDKEKCIFMCQVLSSYFSTGHPEVLAQRLGSGVNIS